MTTDTDWFKRVQQLHLPAVLPVNSLPQADAPLGEWMDVIREDPLLTIHLFRFANKMLASHDVSVRTLDQAVSLLGNNRLVELTTKVPRIAENTPSEKGLLRVIGDSLLAASLMRQWFEIRRIPWTEADYWMTLFYDIGLWVCWLLEPEKMETIENRVREGENREHLIEQFMGVNTRDWNLKLCNYFQLPVLPDEDTIAQSGAHLQPFKKSALKFFLPFSHELSFAVRQDWNSDAMKTLCRTGETSLGLPDFYQQLKVWVANAAREFRLHHTATAARHLLAQQPSVSTSHDCGGFSESDLAAANKIAAAAIERSKSEQKSIWDITDESLPSISEIDLGTDTSFTDSNEWPILNKPTRRLSVDLDAQKEIRRQFRNRKTWHSALEIQESALFGLRKGLRLSRIVTMEAEGGFWQVFDSDGCKTSPLLRRLKFPMHSSEFITQLSKKVTTLWVNDSNREKADRLLPPPLMMAAGGEGFFLRSFAIGSDITMLLYADAFEQSDYLNEIDYQLFRDYCADWNVALNKMRS
ncbi:HDOD domain-containing protein [Reinekea marinisedimentorum]|uniref:HDOD domain-containing protein n=1 Tax=Reinekea marinisedimentorum TaxID=230495 RepID=A0A4R3IE35_9GAMM|nr:HDOD domain-containing protein [Reinekea marinisedimentorum]TCS43041.1 HDOD domain-containing protein [Reinekea marinisedimentorum]